MNRFHMIFDVGFVLIFFATTLASEQPCFSVPFNVFLQDYPVCC